MKEDGHDVELLLDDDTAEKRAMVLERLRQGMLRLIITTLPLRGISVERVNVIFQVQSTILVAYRQSLLVPIILGLKEVSVLVFSVFCNTLKKVLGCLADVICMVHITYKMINNALLFDNSRLGFFRLKI